MEFLAVGFAKDSSRMLNYLKTTHKVISGHFSSIEMGLQVLLTTYIAIGAIWGAGIILFSMQAVDASGKKECRILWHSVSRT
jgi:hypothetical protein